MHLVFQTTTLGEHTKISNHGVSFSGNVTCLCASFPRQEHHTPGQCSSTLGPHRSRVSVLGLPHRSGSIEGFAAKLGFLRRIANRRDPLVIRDLYMHCILPAAEYASEVWSGLSTTDAIRLEKLNRRAARLILNVSSSSQISQDHDILLARASLQLISIRRKLFQAMFCFKHFKGFHTEHVKLAIDNWLPAPSRHTIEQGSNTLRLPRSQKNIWKNSPFHCAFSTWNSLLEQIRLSPTSASIKHYFFCLASFSLLIHLTGPSLFYSCTLLSFFC